MLVQIVNKFRYRLLQKRLDTLENKAGVAAEIDTQTTSFIEENANDLNIAASNEAMALVDEAKPQTQALPTKDDLTVIKGIGKRIAEQLNDLGIYNIEQLAQLTHSQIEDIKNGMPSFKNRIERDNWVGQAQVLSGINN